MGKYDMIFAIILAILIAGFMVFFPPMLSDYRTEQAHTDYTDGCIDVDLYYDSDIYKDEIDKMILMDNARGNNVTLKDLVCKEV